MVISFSVPRVREYLMTNGFVYTYRKRERKRLGKTWMNSGRGKKKIADVIIKEVRRVNNEYLIEQIREYSAHSGFDSVEQWKRVILNLNKNQLGGHGWLYKVTLQNISGNETILDEIRFFIREAPYGFLSNFERTPFKVDGKTYPTNEHYYQCQKTENEAVSEWIRSAPHARLAMVIGRQLEHNKYLKDKYMKPDWAHQKQAVMLNGLRHKFFGVLAEQLLSTGNAILHEDNPEDFYWGIADGSGESWLGKLLMQVRGELDSLIKDPLSQELIKKAMEESHNSSRKET